MRRGHSLPVGSVLPERAERRTRTQLEKTPKADRAERRSRGDNLVEFGVPELPTSPSNIHTLVIVGQIEGHVILPSQNKTTKYEHVIPQLVAIEESPEIEGLLVVLNTVGGDVEAGLALAEMIASLSKPTVSLILGGGHSIGAPIAVATDYCYIAPTATITIHPIRMTGMVIGVPQTYEYLDKMQDRVVHFVCNHSNITEEKYRELMVRTGELARDIGTVLVGRDAVDVGLVDAVGGLNDAMQRLKAMIGERRPPVRGRVKRAVADDRMAKEPKATPARRGRKSSPADHVVPAEEVPPSP